MADIDFERASALMDVIHKVSTISPKCTSILGLAQEELAEIEADAKAIREAAAKKVEVKEPEKTSSTVFPKGVTNERKI